MKTSIKEKLGILAIIMFVGLFATGMTHLSVWFLTATELQENMNLHWPWFYIGTQGIIIFIWVMFELIVFPFIDWILERIK